MLGALPYLTAAVLIAFGSRPARPVAVRRWSDELSEPWLETPDQSNAAEPGRGRRARSPAQIPAKGWQDIAWRVYRQIGIDRLPAVSGGVAFYALLALFPALGAFVSLYGLFADVATAEHQLQQLAGVFPASVMQIIGDQMIRLAAARNGQLSLAFALSLLLSVWSANAGMNALFDGLNVAYGEREKRGVLRRTLVTLTFTAGLVVFVALVSGVLVAIPMLMKGLGLGDLDALWEAGSWLVVFLFTAAALSVVYRYGPSRQPARWRWVGWGAPAAALLWLGSSLGFSWYVKHLGHYDVTYGSLGAVIAFMVWLWFSVLIVLLGAELNAEMEHQTAVDTTTGAALPMGARGAVMADSIGLPLHGGLKGAFLRLIGKAGPAKAQPKLKPLPATPAAPPGPRRSRD